MKFWKLVTDKEGHVQEFDCHITNTMWEGFFKNWTSVWTGWLILSLGDYCTCDEIKSFIMQIENNEAPAENSSSNLKTFTKNHIFVLQLPTCPGHVWSPDMLFEGYKGL